MKKAFFLFFAALILNACGQNSKPQQNNIPMSSDKKETNVPQYSTTNIDTITLGAGCFWCVEAVFQRLNGVLSVKSGYSGGTVKNPSYKEVCTGETGHAEVAEIVYDKNKLTFDELLEVYWKTHDPTTMNAQGNDFGTQYRSSLLHS